MSSNMRSNSKEAARNLGRKPASSGTLLGALKALTSGKVTALPAIESISDQAPRNPRLVALPGQIVQDAALARMSLRNGSSQWHETTEQRIVECVSTLSLQITASGLVSEDSSQLLERLAEDVIETRESLSDDLIELIVKVVLDACHATASERDLKHALDILRSFHTNTSWPEQYWKPFMCILCAIHFRVDLLRAQSWHLFLDILDSAAAYRCLETLLDVFRGVAGDDGPNRFQVGGALNLLSAAIAEVEDIDDVANDLPQWLEALATSQALYDDMIDKCVMQLLFSMLKRAEIVDIVFAASEWSLFARAIILCSQRRQASIEAQLKPERSLGRFRNQSDNDSDIRIEDHPAALDSAAILQEIADALMVHCLSASATFHRKTAVMHLLLELSEGLTDKVVESVIESHQEQGLLMPGGNDADNEWRSNCQNIIDHVFVDTRRGSNARRQVVSCIAETYSLAVVMDVEPPNEMLLSLVGRLSGEADILVLESLTMLIVQIGTLTIDEGLFKSLIKILQDALEKGPTAMVPPSPRSPDLGSDLSLPLVAVVASDHTPSIILAKSIVHLFLRNLLTHAWKCQHLYVVLLKIAGSHIVPTDSRITALKVLARLRSSAGYGIWVKAKTECESLAASLCRTAETLIGLTQDDLDSPVIRPTRAEDHLARRKVHNVAWQTASPSMRPISKGAKSSPGSAKVGRPTPPLWLYPGTKGLPEDPANEPSWCLRSCADENNVEKGSMNPARHHLQVNLWLELILQTLQQDELEWEVYSYILVHLGAQLMNHTLFVTCRLQIQLLRSVICNQLLNQSFHEPPSWTNLKKVDVSICLYHILIVLVTYNEYFAKSEEEEMVKVFVHGISLSERSSEICIHGLSICCHELPTRVSKFIQGALERFTQVITQQHLAVHILEFLAGAARLPSLFRDFRQEEFKLVFAICFRYLEYVRDQSKKNKGPGTSKDNFTSRVVKSNASNYGNPHSSQDSFDTRPSPRSSGRSLANELPQYVYALAYHTMVFWFMALKLQDRPAQMGWISQSLVYKDDKGGDTMEEQAVVTIDFMHRIAFSDHDQTAHNPHFAEEWDGHITKKIWLAGMSILTIETAGRTGVSQLTRRRPSGTKYTVLRPNIIEPPPHQVLISYGRTFEDSQFADTYVGILPDDIVQQVYTPANMMTAATRAAAPIVLPDDESTNRAIRSFDRISPLDGHKVGIIYVAPGQSRESEILANTTGSLDYLTFLNGIGTKVPLRGAKFNTQGLDRDNDADGPLAVCWRDRVTELVFHTTTMMPTDLEADPACANKKRHTGNDFVNVIFDESELPFDFDTFPSAFNLVNIHVVPEAAESQAEAAARTMRLRQPDAAGAAGGAGPDVGGSTETFYKVTTLTQTSLPGISPACEPKCISARSLPAFVRLVALNASVFAGTWEASRHDGAGTGGPDGEHISSWRGRLREIKRLRERVNAAGNAGGGGVTMTATAGRIGAV